MTSLTYCSECSDDLHDQLVCHMLHQRLAIDQVPKDGNNQVPKDGEEEFDLKEFDLKEFDLEEFDLKEDNLEEDELEEDDL